MTIHYYHFFLFWKSAHCWATAEPYIPRHRFLHHSQVTELRIWTKMHHIKLTQILDFADRSFFLSPAVSWRSSVTSWRSSVRRWSWDPPARSRLLQWDSQNGSYLQAPTLLITGATSLVIFYNKIQWQVNFILIQMNFCTHDTTTQLSCHVQNFVAIRWPRMKCRTKFPSNLNYDGNIVSEMNPWAHIWDCQTDRSVSSSDQIFLIQYIRNVEKL